MSYENVGRVWTPQSLREYLATLTRPAWCDSITLHHTASPSLAQRPAGLTAQHLVNLRSFYRDTKGWSAGPHLFVDEDQLWGMCDFRKPGVHSVSFNRRSIGIEVLGDYDSEPATTGRGLACWKTAAAGSRALLDWLGLRASAKTVLFHRDDPTTSKTCPGRKVTKLWVLGLIADGEAPRLPAGDAFALQESVPVRKYLIERGVSEAAIAAKLKKRGEFYFYGEQLIEGAFYDKATESTWAPLRELEGIVP